MAIDAVLKEYSLDGAAVVRLAGGTINDVYRVDHASGAYVLKCYSGLSPDPERLALMEAAAALVSEAGIAVPATVAAESGLPYVLCEGRYQVLTRFIPGRTVLLPNLSETAARAMGEALHRVHEALAGLPPGLQWHLDDPGLVESHLLSLLAAAQRRDDPLDAVAVGILECKLKMLPRSWKCPISNRIGFTVISDTATCSWMRKTVWWP